MARVRILSEQRIFLPRGEGNLDHQVVIVYRPEGSLQARSLQVPAVQLPDVQWRLDNPGQGDPPDDVQEAGEQARQRLIRRDLERPGPPQPRDIEV